MTAAEAAALLAMADEWELHGHHLAWFEAAAQLRAKVATLRELA